MTIKLFPDFIVLAVLALTVISEIVAGTWYVVSSPFVRRGDRLTRLGTGIFWLATAIGLSFLYLWLLMRWVDVA